MKINIAELRRTIALEYEISEEVELQLLDRVEAGEKLKTAAQKVHDEIYPREVFVGCDSCRDETCDC